MNGGVNEHPTDKAYCWSVITAIHRRGSDASDIRDAAHEACHALDAKLHGKWERERIHRALTKHCGDVGSMVYYEVRARAVERLVTEHFGVPYDRDHWLNVCYLETAKFGVALPSFGWLVEQVDKHRERAVTLRMVENILALGETRANRKVP